MDLASMAPYMMTDDEKDRLHDATSTDRVLRVIDDVLSFHDGTWESAWQPEAFNELRALKRNLEARRRLDSLSPVHRHQFRLLNWQLNEGADDDDVPAENRERDMVFKTHTGYGGVSIISKEAFGDAEVHVELDDRGLHLLVHLEGEYEEPALSAHINKDGVTVDHE